MVADGIGFGVGVGVRVMFRVSGGRFGVVTV